jgi:hypothetical protein
MAGEQVHQRAGYNKATEMFGGVKEAGRPSLILDAVFSIMPQVSGSFLFPENITNNSRLPTAEVHYHAAKFHIGY